MKTKDPERIKEHGKRMQEIINDQQMNYADLARLLGFSKGDSVRVKK
jgi:hypothetical protein